MTNWGGGKKVKVSRRAIANDVDCQTIVEENTATGVTYVGSARYFDDDGDKIKKSEPYWNIKKITKTGTTTITTEIYHADGTPDDFTKVWDNRATYDYVIEA
jgi:hypothetical protein